MQLHTAKSMAHCSVCQISLAHDDDASNDLKHLVLHKYAVCAVENCVRVSDAEIYNVAAHAN
jgi:hypothetical protein